MVKLMKKALRTLIDYPNKLLRSEEFVTLVAEAVAFLNRRPLIAEGTHVDPEMITPAHFLLTGSPGLGMGRENEESDLS